MASLLEEQAEDTLISGFWYLVFLPPTPLLKIEQFSYFSITEIPSGFELRATRL
jgi:hypothetical protein